MAIDIKKLCVSSLLELCQKEPLSAITVSQLLKETGISRQTFYNHFIDKNDLICYTYDHVIVPQFHEDQLHIDFYHALLAVFENMKTYRVFMKQACQMEGQNCLKDHMFQHCQEFDLKWHQKLYGHQPMSEALRFATIYHANASSSMTLSWIMSDMPVSCEDIAKMIVQMRSIGMDKLFQDSENQVNPYIKN